MTTLQTLLAQYQMNAKWRQPGKNMPAETSTAEPGINCPKARDYAYGLCRRVSP